jgi:uncharacterized protein YbbK (DUF523 family)
MRLCSACLIGVKCRFNGEAKTDKKVLALLKKEVLIPVCPEQLGGLPTPREPAEQKGRRVVTRSGMDVTENFIKGAKETLKIAKTLDIKEAILKQKSPSCGSGQIFDGSFSNVLINGDGITAALLKKNKISVISETEL